MVEFPYEVAKSWEKKKKGGFVNVANNKQTLFYMKHSIEYMEGLKLKICFLLWTWYSQTLHQRLKIVKVYGNVKA